jgi:predicted branched-subunit amino acid permease
MGALADIWKSERGLIVVLLVVGATIGMLMGQVTFDQWSTYTLTIFGIYAGSKTVTGGMQIWKSAKSPTATVTTPDGTTVTQQGSDTAPAGDAK